jgi:hypothetical protein
MVIQISKQNPYTYTFTPGNGKLVINGIQSGLKINLSTGVPGSIVSIYDVTAALTIPMDSATVAKTTVAGLTVYTITWTTLPGGLANGDTLLINVLVPPSFADYSLLQYQKA